MSRLNITSRVLVDIDRLLEDEVELNPIFFAQLKGPNYRACLIEMRQVD